MGLTIVLYHTRDTKVAQYKFCMFPITEEKVSRLDIFVQNAHLMTICQSSSTLKSNTAELIHIPIKFILCHRTTVQILHQLIVTMLSVNVCLTIIEDFHYHFEIEVQHSLQNLSINVEVWVVNFKHVFLLVFFNQEHLRLTRILT